MYLRYFKISDFDCQETKENRMNENFLIKLDSLRHVCNFPFIITSGYRSPIHQIEMAKKAPGVHTEGIAADIRITGANRRYTIVEHAIKMGFRGIGIGETFVHVDDRKTKPVIWTYY